MKKKNIGIDDISIEVVRNSPFFRNEDMKIMFEGKIIKTLIKIINLYEQVGAKNIRERLRLNYLKEMINFMNRKKSVVCAAGWVSCFLDPNGFLYPCSMMKQAIGNVKEKNIEELFRSKKMKIWRNKYKNCNLCWSGCEGIISLVQNSLFF